jgi:perosamine synthetase
MGMTFRPGQPPPQRPGTPSHREGFIPYGRQWVNEDDIRAVVEVLRSDWLTTGPQVEAFEREFANFVGAGEAVAVSSGTAALHAAVYAAGVGPGDEVILPSLTFVATANAVVYQGATPVFADVDPDTLLIDPAQVEAKATPKTKAIIAVDYAGQPCDYDSLRAVTDRHGLILIADACHSLGGSYKGRPVGSLADLNTFSFHPVKAMTTGEGGMVTTGSPEWIQRMRAFRNHGIGTDHHQRACLGAWSYEMKDLGYNYRLSDLQCALGRSQLWRVAGWVARRGEIARRYDAELAGIPGVVPLRVRSGVVHAYHLYPVRVDADCVAGGRDGLFARLREEGIGVTVHYPPVSLQPFYRLRFSTGPGHCPVAEEASRQLLSLPLFPQMQPQEEAQVLAAVRRLVMDPSQPGSRPSSPCGTGIFQC